MGILAAGSDWGQWIKDYGGFASAVLVVIVGVLNVWQGVRGARESRRREWAREVRLPAYLAFARAVDVLQTEANMRWEKADVGDQQWSYDPRPFNDLIGDVWSKETDVQLVGPREVAQRADLLKRAVLAYRWGAARETGISDDEDADYRDAMAQYRDALQQALDLPS